MKASWPSWSSSANGKTSLILDDIYHTLVFDGRSPPNSLRFSKAEVDNSKVIVINGISKLYGMTGFRIGWAIANRQIIEVMTNVQAQTTSCPATILQAAAEGALTGIQSVTESLRMTIENNRDVALRELAALPGVRTVRPGGAFYCLPDFRAYRTDSVELSRFLLEKALVVTVPGREFGMEGTCASATPDPPARSMASPESVGLHSQRITGNLYRGLEEGPGLGEN
jgi:aspartate aminotransferase